MGHSGAFFGCYEYPNKPPDRSITRAISNVPKVIFSLTLKESSSAYRGDPFADVTTRKNKQRRKI
jgi:hypothetical protein